MAPDASGAGRRWKANLPLLVLVALTGAHAIYRGTAPGPAANEVKSVSIHAVGDTVVPMEIETFGPGDGVSSRQLFDTALPCQLVVAYGSTCPYSAESARREAAQRRAVRLPITWVTDDESDDGEWFRSAVHPSSVVGHSAEALAALKIRGVPAAFLLGSGGRILRIWPYRGDESHADLLATCESQAGGALKGMIE